MTDRYYAMMQTFIMLTKYKGKSHQQYRVMDALHYFSRSYVHRVRSMLICPLLFELCSGIMKQEVQLAINLNLQRLWDLTIKLTTLLHSWNSRTKFTAGQSTTQTIWFLSTHQRAETSVVLSDLCDLNRTVYLYVLSCISLFLYTIIAGQQDAATVFGFFTITVLVWYIRNFAWQELHQNHLCSLFLTATLYPFNLAYRGYFLNIKKTASTEIWTPDLSHPKRARQSCTTEMLNDTAWIKSNNSNFKISM
jgi:hypothetical protein